MRQSVFSAFVVLLWRDEIISKWMCGIHICTSNRGIVSREGGLFLVIMSSSFFFLDTSLFSSVWQIPFHSSTLKNIYLSAVSLGIERGLHFSLIMKFSLDWQRMRRISTSWKICLTFCEIIIFFPQSKLFSFHSQRWMNKRSRILLSKAVKSCQNMCLHRKLRNYNHMWYLIRIVLL